LIDERTGPAGATGGSKVQHVAPGHEPAPLLIAGPDTCLIGDVAGNSTTRFPPLPAGPPPAAHIYPLDLGRIGEGLLGPLEDLDVIPVAQVDEVLGVAHAQGVDLARAVQ
jgi:hypothetical protein